jgi:hypothetical protein
MNVLQQAASLMTEEVNEDENIPYDDNILSSFDLRK